MIPMELAAIVLRDDLSRLMLFLASVECHLACNHEDGSPRDPSVCLQSILNRYKQLEQDGVVRRMERAFVT